MIYCGLLRDSSDKCLCLGTHYTVRHLSEISAFFMNLKKLEHFFYKFKLCSSVHFHIACVTVSYPLLYGCFHGSNFLGHSFLKKLVLSEFYLFSHKKDCPLSMVFAKGHIPPLKILWQVAILTGYPKRFFFSFRKQSGWICRRTSISRVRFRLTTSFFWWIF